MAESSRAERLNALSDKIKEHTQEAHAVKPQNGSRLTPGAAAHPAAATGAVKPTAVKPTAAGTAAVKPTGTAAVKPTAAANPAARPTTAAKVGRFTDVSADAYYAEAVEWAVQRGITTGVTDTTFAPDNPCHKGHAATFLWRFLGSPKPRSGKNPFQDVKDGPFYEAILWAAENGIIAGETDTTFVHTTPCTRRQVLTYLLRTQGKPRATEDEAVQWAAQKHLLQGTAGGVNVPCTRADMVTFLYRASKK